MHRLVLNFSHYTGLILQCLILINLCESIKSSRSNATVNKDFSARNLGRSMAQCISSAEKIKCLQVELVKAVDMAAQDNAAWHYSDFLIFEKDETMSESSKLSYEDILNAAKGRAEPTFSDVIGSKLLQLVQSRSIKLKLPQQTAAQLRRLGTDTADDDAAAAADRGISNAIDVFSAYPAGLQVLVAEEGTVRVFNGLVDDKIELISSGSKITKTKKKKFKKKSDKYKPPFSYIKNPLKGRKKKDKDKNMAMMGGMAMMAMVAQMFLGKVILIAGAAFIMAKIALLVSVLVSSCNWHHML